MERDAFQMERAIKREAFQVKTDKEIAKICRAVRELTGYNQNQSCNLEKS